MSKKDYECMARILAKYVLKDRKVVEKIAKELATCYQEDNPNFQPVKFYNAIGIAQLTK